MNLQLVGEAVALWHAACVLYCFGWCVQEGRCCWPAACVCCSCGGCLSDADVCLRCCKCNRKRSHAEHLMTVHTCVAGLLSTQREASAAGSSTQRDLHAYYSDWLLASIATRIACEYAMLQQVLGHCLLHCVVHKMEVHSGLQVNAQLRKSSSVGLASPPPKFSWCSKWALMQARILAASHCVAPYGVGHWWANLVVATLVIGNR
ncbi:hypothetical protein COO60DRAFT_743912 [Scenedesmus sp. NREL 46B-D3]|nr:hypothetical protein COO60DRAFT_743912 [Scenedesmus sp. NREL 46B-D3]